MMTHEKYRQSLARLRTLSGQLISKHFATHLAGEGTIGLVIPSAKGHGRHPPSRDVRIAFEPTVGRAGRQQGRASLFTFTSKMRCASYSLPAGPPAIGGTCRSAALGMSTDNPNEFICHGCYAVGGRYGETCGVVQISQAARMVWTKQTLLEDEPEKQFAPQFVKGLEQLWRAPRVDRYKNPVNPNFFRLHDCGDLGLDPSGLYYNAWCDIAEAFPQVMFWAPTREWASRATWWKQRERPRNFILRPSALHVFDKPPRSKGLDAGSTASPGGIHADWDCPAYASKENTYNCESVEGPDGGKPCRACWTHPQLSVNYTPHGALKTMLRSTGKWPGAKAPRKQNPVPDIDELWDEYESRPRSNPPMREFEAWLLTQGIDPSSWGEDRWLKVYQERLGLTRDEAIDLYEGMAEYQP